MILFCFYEKPISVESFNCEGHFRGQYHFNVKRLHFPGNVCFRKGMQETVDMNKCRRGNMMRTWYIWKAKTRWTGEIQYGMVSERVP